MEFKKLQNKVCYYWIIIRFIFLVILSIGFMIGLKYISDEFKLLLMVPGGLLLFVIFTNTFIFPFLQIKVYKYFIDNEKIVISYGVLFRHYSIIPIIQIQDISSFQGPIQIGFKISNVIITTAGSSEAIKCVDSELAKGIVEEIHDKIHQRLNKDEHNEALS